MNDPRIVFQPTPGQRPQQSFSLPGRENGDTGGNVDFEAVLAEARRDHRCAECGSPLEPWQRVTSAFCSPRCRYRFRDKRRYAENPEGERAKARAYYTANREKVLEKAAARRGRPQTPALTECSECGGPLETRQRVVCSVRCRDARYRRHHPAEYAAKEARKVERRRERRRAARAEGGDAL